MVRQIGLSQNFEWELGLKVDLVDLGIGNAQSVCNWLTDAKCEVERITKVEDLSSDLVVMPGVGAVKQFMSKLTTSGFEKAIIKHVERGGRLLGICLGFQVMFEHSDEDGGVKTLGLLHGHVERLKGNATHNGWEKFHHNLSDVKLYGCWRKARLTRRHILNGRFFYNHEYAAVNGSKKQFALPVSEALSQYSGLVVKENVIGMQFHPEKSQKSGAELLKFIL